MAMESMASLLLLLTAFISISTLEAAEANDESALLAFKAAAVGGGSQLASWNSSSSAGGFCSWEGVTCGAKHRRVVALRLPSQGLAGVLSPAIGNLSFLRALRLDSNAFNGDIPGSLGRLHRLQVLNLSNNAFSGELPVNLSSCTSLKTMALFSNQLRGSVPPEFGDRLKHLTLLDLYKNNLTGMIPVSLVNLTSLSFLCLAFNQLEGTIPPGLDRILGLQYLALAYNRLSGEPPISLYNSSSLEKLQIQANMLHGSIPARTVSTFPSMLRLAFGGNQFTGSIPSWMSNISTLKYLDLSTNRFSGYVPHSLGRLGALQNLYLFSNMLEANQKKGWEFITSLSNCTQLKSLQFPRNIGFTGQLPSSISNLSTTLQFLQMGETSISGRIPSAIGNLVGLEQLSISNTFISELIPPSISKLGNLAMLDLSTTNLSGQIPSSLGNLTSLTYLYTDNGNFDGEIPASLGKLKNLAELDLSVNHFNGPVPIEIFRLPVLSSFLDLSYNSLSGPLPSEVGSLGNLNQLVLSGNQLSGEIPESIGGCSVLERLLLDNNSFKGIIPQSIMNLKGLSALNLSMNKLSGNIPNAIGSIRNLQQLYLAHNNFSGQIPTDLQNLTSLSELDLSFNNLEGQVPKDGIFRILTNFSITGNNQLCGGVLQLHLAPCHTNYVKNHRKWRLQSLTIALVTICALLFLAFITVLIKFKYMKLRRKPKSQFLPPIIEEHYERVSYQALANGTDGFSEANLLGKGSFGAVYKCNFQDERIIAAVKVFDPEQSRSAKSFVVECEAMRRVRHRCLVKIITCCSSVNHQGQEFKALVFEWMPHGSLNDWLHPKYGMPTPSNTLNLAQRLDIAVNIVDALGYLHNHCQPPIIHCDIKPSNILLAEDMSARVGDLGISRILPEKASQTLQNSNSTVGIRGSIGYVAPEYGEGSSISTLSDVYSLGILLLEMFTGRSPTDDMFHGSLDLHKFSEDALLERIWDIADVTMWLHTDAYAHTTRHGTENCLVSVIALGISCSKKQPRERTPIQDAVNEMHAIRDSYLLFA